MKFYLMNTSCNTLSTSDKLKTNVLKNDIFEFLFIKHFASNEDFSCFIQDGISDNVTGYKIKERINNTHIL